MTGKTQTVNWRQFVAEPEEARDQRHVTMLTATEMAALQEVAEEAGITKSELTRAILRGAGVIPNG